ncbi:hypothetical protein [Pseudomonas sp. S2_A02]|jgi:hypothetical protein
MVMCSGVLLVGYGADVTPRIFYENFIDVMVNIDADDDYNDGPVGLIAKALLHLTDELTAPPLWPSAIFGSCYKERVAEEI